MHRISFMCALMMLGCGDGKTDADGSASNSETSAKASAEKTTEVGCTFDPAPCTKKKASNELKGPEKTPRVDPRALPGLTIGETPSRGAEGQSDPVVIVKWSDFRCGHCGTLAETLKEALKREPQAFRSHFRQFPLDKTCNPTWSEDVAPGNSCLAAYAMVCADKQGHAWTMHDRIFDNQMGLQNQAEKEAGPMLRAIAQGIGLDMDRYDTCLTKADTKNTVQLDIDAARDVGIRGTPLWFMNGVKQSNEVTAGIVLRLSKVARERAEKDATDKEKISIPKTWKSFP